MEASAEACAAETLDTLWLVMRAVKQARAARGGDLSMPQYRVLWFLHRHPGASLSDVAQHQSLGLSSVSGTVELLVERGLVARAERPSDRRCVTLTLTPQGAELLAAERAAMQARLAERLEPLSAAQRGAVVEAMQALRGAFTPAAVEES